MRCWMMMSISTRFDDEISKRNLEQISMRLTRLMIRIAYVSTRFLCQGFTKISPCGLTNCRSHATLAKSTIPWHIYHHNLCSIYLEYLQIPKRLPTHIIHAFIFNKPFTNIIMGIFGIIRYKQRQKTSSFILYRL